MLKNKKVLFIDLDGTIIEPISGSTFPSFIGDFQFKIPSLHAIKKFFCLGGDYCFVISNQAGVEAGYVTEEAMTAKLQFIKTALKDFFGFSTINTHFTSLTSPEEPVIEVMASYEAKSKYTKPQTGMLEHLVSKCKIDLPKEQMFMVGDASGTVFDWSDTDKRTAMNFEIDYMDVKDFINWGIEI
jgi:DNA 3'-phosphatase